MSKTSCVIGAGPGGYVCAIRLSQLGIKTTLVERMSTMGGVCLNWGCIPTKAFISASKLWTHVQSAAEIGIEVGTASVDMSKMKDWKDQIVSRLTSGVKELLRQNKVTVLQGSATFTGPDSIDVRAEDGSTTSISADTFVVATGSTSARIPGFEIDQQTIVTSRGALNFDKVPGHLLVIGGGVIGLEIGQYMMKLGSKLTVVEMTDGLLPGTDPDCTRVVARKLNKNKAILHLGSKALGATVKGRKVEVVIETPKGEVTVTADKVLISVGRAPNSEGLGLDKAGIQVDRRGFLTIDRQLRTSNHKVFAIGDVAGGVLLAHKASKEGLIAAAVIAGSQDVMDAVIPSAIFTDPEISAVGLTEAEAHEKGYEVKTGLFPFAASGRALSTRETEGFVKVIADAADDRLLGVHICGPHASELISEAALALETGLTAEDVALTVHTHPTLSEAFMEAAEDVHRMAVHIYHPT